MPFSLVEEVLAEFRHVVEQLVARADAHQVDLAGIDHRYGQRLGYGCTLDLRARNRDFVEQIFVVLCFLCEGGGCNKGQQHHANEK